MNPFNWTCPHCNKPQVVTNANYYESRRPISNPSSSLGDLATVVMSIVCLNTECEKVMLKILLFKRDDYAGTDAFKLVEQIGEWRLIPESSAKPQPEFIPADIRQDYYEACRIAELSPKASATLARRCLQGMIRDFCGIQKNRLIDEIKALRDLVKEGTAPRGVSPESVDAIDHVREIGNIGAHMEKDVSVIIDIDPGEATNLIELIEMLFEEWYVARNEREKRLSRVASINADKKTAKQQAVPAAE
jgi:hypothetical protein